MACKEQWLGFLEAVELDEASAEKALGFRRVGMSCRQRFSTDLQAFPE